MSTNSTQAHQVSHKLLVGTVSGKRRGLGKAKGEQPVRGEWSRATSLQRADNVVYETYNSRFRNATRGHSTSHSAPRDFPLGASRLPTRKSATSHSEGCDFPVGASQIPLGNPTRSFSAGEWDFQIAARKASGRTGGAPRGGEGGGSRGEAALAVSHSAARVGGSPLPCARHFLWGTFLSIAAAPPFPPFSAHRWSLEGN